MLTSRNMDDSWPKRREMTPFVPAESTDAKRKWEAMCPRIVLLDDSPEVLAILSNVVRSCWERAIIVACTDSYAAWDELQRHPPDLFITDLIHGGIDGFQLLARLAEREVAYPIVVLSGNLPEREAEVRAAAGPKLRVSYLHKFVRVQDSFRINRAPFRDRDGGDGGESK